MSGYEKAKETADKLKEEKAETEEMALETKKQAVNELDAIKANSELSKMYQESATVGASNLSGETPLLKVHAVGRSKNELADGSEPNDGFFFYKPTGEQFEYVEAHILTISKGYKAPGMAQGSEEAKEGFNQLLGGIIVHEGEYKPFVMYFTGLKLSHLWEFGKQASKYTKAKPFSIPMFALTVKLTTEKIKNTYGTSWVVTFEIVKNEEGDPKLVTDQGEFQFLKDSVSISEEIIASVIAATEVKKAIPVDELQEAEVVNGSDRPF